MGWVRSSRDGLVEVFDAIVRFFHKHAHTHELGGNDELTLGHLAGQVTIDQHGVFPSGDLHPEYVLDAEVGQAGGVAPLDVDALLPVLYLPHHTHTTQDIVGLDLELNQKVGQGFTTTTQAGDKITGAGYVAGFSLAVPAYLTTAAPVGAYLTTAALSADSSRYARTGFTTQAQGGSVVAGTHDTNGLLLGVPAYLTTAQAPGAYLTTAMASERGSDFVQATAAFHGTNASGTIASDGISVSVAAPSGTAGTGFTSTTAGGAVVAGTLDGGGLLLAVPAFLTTAQPAGAYLTTAMASNRGSDFVAASAVFHGTSISGTIASDGLSLSVGPYLTTAALSADSSKYAGVGETVGTVAGTDLGLTVNTDGVSIKQPLWLTTAQPVGAYLTTAALSADSSKYAATGFTTTTVAGTAVAGTHNTDGLKLAVPAYLTTAQPTGAYLTTAALSQDSSKYAGVGETVGTTAGSDLALTVDTNGVSIAYPKWLTTAQAVGAYLTTAALSADSSKYAGINGAITGGSITVNTSGVSINLPAYLTTAALSADSSKYAATGFTTTTGAGVVIAGTHDTAGLKLAVPAYLTTAQPVGAYLTTAALSGDTTKYAGVGETVGTIAGSDLALTVNTDGVSIGYAKWLTTAGLSADSSKYAGTGFTTTTSAGAVIAGTNDTAGLKLGVPAYLTTAMASGRGTDFVQATAAFAGTNASGTINSTGISVSVLPPGGETASFYEDFPLIAGTATSTGSASQLQLQPFYLEKNLSFGQVNVIGSASLPVSSVGNTFSFRLALLESIGYSAVYTITNAALIDLFLFSRGTGGFSSELETFASTRNSINTYFQLTFSAKANLTGGSSGSMTAWQTVSVIVSYPALTSGTVTSISTNTTVTTWGTGYSSWAPAAVNTSVTNTYATSATASTSVASTFPATTEWALQKLVPLMFATSLPPGDYWIGMPRAVSSSSSSTFGSSIASATTNASYTITYNASNMTLTGQMTWVGATNSIANSLGWLGSSAGAAASLAPMPGHGSFSGTWDKGSTYLNNAGNPNGAVAFSQIRSDTSFFRTWQQFASQRI